MNIPARRQGDKVPQMIANMLFSYRGTVVKSNYILVSNEESLQFDEARIDAANLVRVPLIHYVPEPKHGSLRAEH